MKSPCSRCFSAGGHGEWSETTRPIVPSSERLPERVAIRALAHGRRALELGAPIADLLGREREVVGAGLRAQRQPLAARLGHERGGARGREMHDVDRRPQLAAQPEQQRHGLALPRGGTRLEVGRVAAGIARPAAPRRAPARRGPAAACRARPGSAARRAGRLRPPRETRRSRSGPGTPSRRTRPRRAASPTSAALPGTSPPQNAQSTLPRPPAASRLRSSASREVVTGLLLSGMSTSVVTPPAAAACVALSKPSHSVRPGSLTWTWLSTRPGSRTRSPTSSVGVPGSTAPSSTTATIRSPRTSTAPARSPSGVTTRRLRTAKSTGALAGRVIGRLNPDTPSARRRRARPCASRARLRAVVLGQSFPGAGCRY